MFTVQRTKKFERSFKKISRSGVKSLIKKEVVFVIDVLASGKKLPEKYRDHKLTGEFRMYRECRARIEECCSWMGSVLCGSSYNLSHRRGRRSRR